MALQPKENAVDTETVCTEKTSKSPPTIKRKAKSNQDNQSLSQYAEGRLKDSVEAVMAIACHDFDYKAKITDLGDGFDGLNTGLNMLGEELKSSTVSRTYLNDIFDSMTDMLIVTDDSGSIKSINRASRENLGLSEEELLEKSVTEIIHFKDAELTNLDPDGVKNLVIEYGSLVGEAIMIAKFGNTLSVEVSISSMSSEGGIVYMAKDISERIRAERKQNKLLRNLQKTNNELKQFAYILSHDIKAPLRGISTLSRWIHDDNIDKVNKESAKNLELLISRTARLFNFIEGVFKYSKVGREKAGNAEVDLSVAIPEVIDSLELPESVKVSIKAELPTILAAKVHMTQLFQNLITNAVKHANRTDVEVHIGYADHPDYWQFNVSDNGPGIPEKHHKRIFKMFQTLVPRDTLESTGIGLNIVKKIVDIYGGNIRLESSPQKGSNFIFTISKQEDQHQILS